MSTGVVGGYVNGVSTEPEESVCVGGSGGYEVITEPAISHWLGNCNFATGIIIKYQLLLLLLCILFTLPPQPLNNSVSQGRQLCDNQHGLKQRHEMVVKTWGPEGGGN